MKRVHSVGPFRRVGEKRTSAREEKRRTPCHAHRKRKFLHHSWEREGASRGHPQKKTTNWEEKEKNSTLKKERAAVSIGG